MFLVLSRWMVSSDAFSTDFHGLKTIFCSFWADLRRLEKGGVRTHGLCSVAVRPWEQENACEGIKMTQEEGASLK